MPDQNDHDTIITLVERVDNLTTAIEKMSVSLENLKSSFVTRDEFSIVKTAVMGVANDGGLVKKVESLEKINSENKGSLRAIHFIYTIIIGLTGILITYFLKR